MAQEFMSDEEITKLGEGTPDFIPDAEAPKYFGAQETQPEIQDAFLRGHGVLKGISDFIGTTGLAKGLAQGIFLRFTKEGQDLLNQMAQGKVTQEDIENITGKTATTKEILGSAAQTALSAATLGGVGATGTLGTRVARTAGLGAGFGAAGALQQDGGLREVATGAAIGGAVGGAIPLVGAGLRGIGRNLTEVLPKRLVQSAIGQPKKAILAGKDVSEYVLQTKKIGTTDQLLNSSKNAVKTLSNKIEEVLTKEVPKTVRILKNEPTKAVVDSINAQGGSITAKDVNQIIGQLAPQARGLLTKQSLSLPEANRLRGVLDKTLGDKGFMTTQLPFNKEILRTFDNALREKVKTLAPAGTRELFSELSKEITLRNSLIERAATQAKNQILSLSDFVALGVGGVGGGIPGAVGAIALERAAKSTLGKTITAQALRGAGQVTRPITKAVAPIVKTGVLGGVSRLGEKPKGQ